MGCPSIAALSYMRVIACMLLFAICAATLLPHTQMRALAAETETRPLLVIVAGFDGGDTGKAYPYDDGFDWSAAAFGRDESLSTYYEDMSGGAFTFEPAAETCAYDGASVTNTADQANDGVVHVTLHRPFDAWGTINKDEDVAQGFAHAVFEAFEAAGAYVDYSVYDANGDWIIDPDELVVAMLVPGYDSSSLSDPARTDIPLLWPHSGTISSEGPIASGKKIMHLRSYIALPEYSWNESQGSDAISQEPLGTLYHELGHYLGLPDLYALNSDAADQPWGAYKVGPLSLMDSGGWLQSLDEQGLWHFEPSSLDAWSRYVLGWSMPYVVSESNDYVVSSQWSERGYESLLIPTSDPDQYFLIENRQPEGHDAGYAAAFEAGGSRGGLLIWHIDKSIYRAFGDQNTINDTNHVPGVMPLFFEVSNDDGNYTLSWANTTPNQLEPFFDASGLFALVGTDTLELPLYSGDNGTPSERLGSGITIRVLGDSARDIFVHVELPDTQCAVSEQTYDLPDESDSLHATNAPLGALACTALIRETGANVALLDLTNLKAGLPSGAISFVAAYEALSRDTPIVMYEATGQQVVDVLEESLEKVWEARQGENHDADGESQGQAGDGARDSAGSKQAASSTVLNDALCVGGIACTIDWNAEPHKRVKKMHVNGEKIDLGATYRVASTEETAAHFELGSAWSRETSVLFGSPADALRSYLQSESWEILVRDACGSIRYIEPVEPPDDDQQAPGLQPGSTEGAQSHVQDSGDEQTLPFGLDPKQGIIVSLLMFLYSLSPYALIAVPLVFVLAGFVFTLLRRSK